MDHLNLHDYTYPHAVSNMHIGLDSTQTHAPAADAASASYLDAGHMQRSNGYLSPGHSEHDQPNGEAQQYQQQMMELLELLQAERSKSKVLGSQLSRMTSAQSHLQVRRNISPSFSTFHTQLHAGRHQSLVNTQQYAGLFTQKPSLHNPPPLPFKASSLLLAIWITLCLVLEIHVRHFV